MHNKNDKKIVKNKSQNTNSQSNAGVYKNGCLNCNKLNIGETCRNSSKKIYEYKKDFETGNKINSLVTIF